MRHLGRKVRRSGVIALPLGVVVASDVCKKVVTLNLTDCTSKAPTD